MPIFDRFDVVSVPFPYTDRPVRQRRPALVVSQPAHERATGLIWVVIGFLVLIAVFLGIDPGTRVALYVAPIWFAILAIGYRLVRTEPSPQLT